MTDVSWINQLSIDIENYLAQYLTPENADHFVTAFNNAFSFNTFLSYIGATPGGGKVLHFIQQHASTPMPPEWNDTIGKALEQIRNGKY